MRMPAAVSRLVRLATIAVCIAAPVLAQPSLTPQAANRFQDKLLEIAHFAAPAARAHTAHAIQVTDGEVNSYLRYKAASEIPVGIVDPMLNADGNGRVSAQAVVDLDAVRNAKPRTWSDPMGYLGGRVPLTAAGTLTTTNGVGHFQLESATISGVSIPKSVLQELLSYYSRTPENPQGIDMDDPFALPAGIREIRIGQGQATIVQ
ncbi:MAG TPA: hypothetical protein VFX12_11970 [Vicinamibacterales bacterium]|nr:hypothetical protein [Vicinamibacterales bacterium]